MQRPVLIQPDQKKPFEVKVDASNYAIDAVLMQRNDKNVMHPVAFFSKTMNDVQQNYDVCHDPSHGGFYMAEGTLYIRIRLPPRVVSGDCLVSSRCGLTAQIGRAHV